MPATIRRLSQPLGPRPVKYSALAQKVTCRGAAVTEEQLVGDGQVVAGEDRAAVPGQVLQPVHAGAASPAAARRRRSAW